MITAACTTYIDFMGSTFLVEIELTINSLGSPSCRDDPGTDLDFSINSITLFEHRDDFDEESGYWLDYFGPPFEATGALFQVLASSREIDEAIIETLQAEKETDNIFRD